MKWKYMPKSSSHQSSLFPFATVWLIAALFGLTATAIIAVRMYGRFTYDRVLIDAFAVVPSTPAKGINLHDQQNVSQTFQGQDTAISHLGLGIANLRGADPQATVTATLLDASGRPLATAYTSVASLPTDDVVLLPMLRRLRAETYTLVLATRGVHEPKSLTAFYEFDTHAFLAGDAAVIKNDGRRHPLTGNVRFQIIREPTKRVLMEEGLRHRGLWVVGIYILVLLALLVRPLRRSLTSLLTLPLPLPSPPKIRLAETLFAVVIGTLLAFTVTLPYYTQLDSVTTLGDVQRALVYRAVARTALLQHGETALWDPYLCGGEPLLANAESAQLDPFFPLVLLAGENLGVRLSVTLTLILGFVGTYLLARRLVHADPIPALLAAVLFTFSGFQMLAFANGNFAWIPVGWIPWTVLFFSEALRRTSLIIPASVVTSFIFFGGSIHMTVYALLATSLLAVFIALLYRTVRPLLLFTILLMTLAPLTAIKLLPAAEIQAVSSAFSRPEAFLPPLSWIPKMFWDRGQLATPQWTFANTGENFRWIEYGSYVGILPVILFVVGLPFFLGTKARRAVLFSAVVVLPMIYGYFPWTALHKLPFLNEILRNPQRARSIFLLFFGLLVAVSVSRISRKFLRARGPRLLATAAVVAFVIADLATFHARLYPQLFNLKKPRIAREPQFVRQRESYTDENAGYYKVSYENYRANQGVTDMCNPYLVTRGVAARGVGNADTDKPYRGEAWLSTAGTATLTKLSPNRLSVDIRAQRDGWLIINQNFFPGWRTIPPRPVRPYAGLAAARVNTNDTNITFAYQPRSYRVGKTITLITLLILAAPFLSGLRARKPPLPRDGAPASP